jgi:hypothetical protein
MKSPFYIRLCFVTTCIVVASMAASCSDSQSESFEPVTYEPAESEQNHILDGVFTSEPYEILTSEPSE